VGERLDEGDAVEGARLGESEMVGLAVSPLLDFPFSFFADEGDADTDGNPLGAAEGARLGESEVVGLAVSPFLDFFKRRVPFSFFSFLSFLLPVVGERLDEGDAVVGARLGESEMVGLADLDPFFDFFLPFASA
jgi:hypothetical protein